MKSRNKMKTLNISLFVSVAVFLLSFTASAQPMSEASEDSEIFLLAAAPTIAGGAVDQPCPTKYRFLITATSASSHCAECGDGFAEPPEECDGVGLLGGTCVTQGFSGGVLACKDDCTYDTSGCYKCGDDELNPGEDCDDTIIPETCSSLGYSGGGTLACFPKTCQFDTSGCDPTAPGTLPGNFQVTQTGSATYKIPIAVPPGTAGMQPKLSLVYNSSRGDGDLGMGWTITGLSTIERCPANPAQDGFRGGINYNADDRFCLDGKRLILVNGTYGGSDGEYRTDPESFIKVTSHNSITTPFYGPRRFEVRRPDGSVLQYGGGPSFIIDDEGRIERRLLTPGAPNDGVRVWAINRIDNTAGNYMQYFYEEETDTEDDTGDYRIKEILYTGHSASCAPACDGGSIAPYNKVEFNYIDRDSKEERVVYQAGGKIEITKLLDNIRTYADGIVVNTYYFTYETSAATHRPRLVSVEACAGDEKLSCLPQTTFAWQNGAFDLDAPNINDEKFATNHIRTGPDLPEMYYARDLDNNGLTDLVFLSQTSTPTTGKDSDVLGVLVHKTPSGNYAYSSASSILFPPINTQYACQKSTVEVIQNSKDLLTDMNRDGNTDALMFYDNGPTCTEGSCVGMDVDIHFSDGTQFVYDKTETVIPLPIDPNEKMFPFDYDGDGDSDFIDFRPGVPGGSGNLLVRINAWNGSSFIFPGSQFIAAVTCQGSTLSWSNDLEFFVLDHNGDRKLDFIVIDDQGSIPGTSRAMLFISKSQPTLDFVGDCTTTIDLPPTDQIAGNFVLDLNGDGNTDLISVYAPNPGLSYDANIFLSLGDGTFVESTEDVLGTDSDNANRFVIGDYNGDGMDDLVIVGQTTGNGEDLDYFLSNGGTSFKKYSAINDGFVAWDSSFQYVHADVNGDGLSDSVRLSRAASGSDMDTFARVVTIPGEFPDLMKDVTNGLGLTLTINYKPMSDDSVYDGETSLSGLDSSTRHLRTTNYIVSSYNFPNESTTGGNYQYNFKYRGAKLHYSYGFLGFGRVETFDNQTKFKTGDVYKQMFPFIGLMETKDRSYNDGVVDELMSTEFYSWGSSVLPGGNNLVTLDFYNVANFEMGPSAPLISVKTTTFPSYDPLNGKPLQQVITWSDGSSSETIDFEYFNDTTNWILGLPTKQTITRSAPNQTDQVQLSEFDYDTSTGLLHQIKRRINDGLPIKELITDYMRDEFGNVEKITISGTDIITRFRDYNFDRRGQFIDSIINAASHQTSFTYDHGFGTILTLTDPNLLTTTFDYDGFGRLTSQTLFSGTAKPLTTTWDYKFPTSMEKPTLSNAVFSVVQSTPGQPTLHKFIDRLSRLESTWEKGFDGTNITTSFLYNTKLQLASQSLPYYEGDTRYLTQFAYDNFGRAQKITEPHGTETEITTRTWNQPLESTILSQFLPTTAYELKIENELGQITKQYLDAQGRIIQVQHWEPNEAAKISHTTYAYSPSSDVFKIEDTLGNVITTIHDDWQRKTSLVDPSFGTTNYAHNVLGELVTQTELDGTKTFTYDELSRMTSRMEPEGTSTWTYDPTNGIGLLDKAFGLGGYIEDYKYNTFSQLNQIVTNAPSTFTIDITYDTLHRLDTIAQGTDTLTHNYNSFGYLSSITAGGQSWTLDEMDALGAVTQQTFGDGIITIETDYIYDQEQRTLEEIKTGPGDGTFGIQNLEYKYDALGNLKERRDLNKSTMETFDYDDLNRVKTINTTPTTGGTYPTTLTFDAIGNIKSKSDVGTYVYGEGIAGPQQVTSITGGPLTTTLTYDNNGNMLTGFGRTMVWNSFDKPSSITEGSTQLDFQYGPDRRKIWQMAVNGATSKTTRYDPTGVFQKGVDTSGAGFDYLYANVNGSPMFRVDTNSGAVRFFHKDHLGSIETITDEVGNVVESLSYDTFGQRRNSDWNPAASPITSLETKGYTGHEHLNEAGLEVGLTDMKGRVYDPLLGRFISADPFIVDPFFSEGLNRYSYVYNNPHFYTDPSGFGPSTDCPSFCTDGGGSSLVGPGLLFSGFIGGDIGDTLSNFFGGFSWSGRSSHGGVNIPIAGFGIGFNTPIPADGQTSLGGGLVGGGGGSGGGSSGRGASSGDGDSSPVNKIEVIPIKVDDHLTINIEIENDQVVGYRKIQGGVTYIDNTPFFVIFPVLGQISGVVGSIESLAHIASGEFTLGDLTNIYLTIKGLRKGGLETQKILTIESLYQDIVDAAIGKVGDEAKFDLVPELDDTPNSNSFGVRDHTKTVMPDIILPSSKPKLTPKQRRQQFILRNFGPRSNKSLPLFFRE